MCFSLNLSEMSRNFCDVNSCTFTNNINYIPTLQFLYMKPLFTRQAPNSAQGQQFITYTGNFNNKTMSGAQKNFPPPSINNKKKVQNFKVTMLVLSFIKKIKISLKKRKYRENNMKQLLTTQQSYNTDLKTSLIYIKNPMEKLNLISREQSLILFPELEGMVQLSDMMVNVIQKALEEAKKIKNPYRFVVCNQINKFVNGYKLYGGYFGSHLKSSKLLAQLAQQKQYQIKEIQINMQSQLLKKQSKKANMSIKDCMEQPLYRLSKYVLLIKQYVKRLPKYYPDYQAACKCLQSFHDINNFGNDLMKKLQDQQRRVKLDKFCGGALKQGRILINEMQASTIYFNAKLYIFNDMVTITKVESLLGSERQQKYGNFQLDQFSYVGQQLNLKYFNNILVLISKDYCIHLFFPDEGSRAELFKCLQKIIKDLQVKEYERKKFEEVNSNKDKIKKMTFTLHLQKQPISLFQPEFRAEILGFQVRPLGSFINDTVYCTRLMIPNYLQDQLELMKQRGISEDILFEKRESKKVLAKTQSISQQKQRFLQKFGIKPREDSEQELSYSKIRQSQVKCINQKIQIHFSVLQQIYKEMKNICPNQLPDIDPITKDVNIYAKGKRKTKAYEMRKFFIEEFLNFIFRHEAIMSNPIWFLSKLKVNQSLWDYCRERNSEIRKQAGQTQKNYTYNHCEICRTAKITLQKQQKKSIIIQKYYNVRTSYISSGKGNHRIPHSNSKYCFNFFNLMRLTLISIDYTYFETIQQILLYYHLADGRLDYPFIAHRCNDKMVKLVKIYLPSIDDNFVSVIIDSQSTVGQLIDELAFTYKNTSFFDYDLMATYSGKFRILDRDQYLIDTVKCLNVSFEQVPAQSTTNNDMGQKKTGFFDNIKLWGAQILKTVDKQNKIFLIKTTYLNKLLQLKSLKQFPQKKHLELQKIFYFIKKGLTHLNEAQFIQMAALFYCLNEIDRMEYFSGAKMNRSIIQKILPLNHVHAFYNDQKFRQELVNAIFRQKQEFIKNKKNTDPIHIKVIDKALSKLDYITYFVEAEPREIPQSIMKKQSVPNLLLIGVNYKCFVLTKSVDDTTAVTTIPIQQFEYSHSVFSLFITHESNNYRFDGKMLYHFGEMIRKYQTIAKSFPQSNI